MKKILCLCLFPPIILFFTSTIPSFAQGNIISTVAGTGSIGTSGVVCGFAGDGGPATASRFCEPLGLAIDVAGNVYIGDFSNSRVRKINTAGIITTYVGNGGWSYSGDGGPATAASINGSSFLATDNSGNLFIAGGTFVKKVNPASIITNIAGKYPDYLPYVTGDGGPATNAIITARGMDVDASGNIYFGEEGRVRKVAPSGIISTVAGNGLYSYGGDGGPATDASVGFVLDVKLDPEGNLYLTSGYGVRKVNTAGIITRVVGDSVLGSAPDGGSATAGGVLCGFICFDRYGNLYISGDGGGTGMSNPYIRKVTPWGVITTVAGNGLPGYSGDGGPATAAAIGASTGMAFNSSNELLFLDFLHARLRKLSATPVEASDSFSVIHNITCDSTYFDVFAPRISTGESVVTYYGDGTHTSETFTHSGMYGGYSRIRHQYLLSGDYAIKHILMHGTAAVDSISYNIHFKSCRDIRAIFYLDNNSNCSYESDTDIYAYQPFTVAIDSNGIAVDTIVTPCGFHYIAYGVAGDVYTLRVISTPTTLVMACPTTGIITDTFYATPDSFDTPIYFGFNCSVTTGFDLRAYYVSRARSLSFDGYILVDNTSCVSHAGSLNLNFSDKYILSSSFPASVSSSAHSITWNFTGLSSVMGAPKLATFSSDPFTSPWYPPGDTVNSTVVLNPTTGDANPTDNSYARVDTVRGAVDPNFIDVVPSGYISNAPTRLRYTVGFENTGNDTAHNIYVMDTLPEYLNVSTLKVVATSAFMNLTKIRYGTQLILKFDFPNIMLPDSSHRDLCHGMFVYDVTTKPGIVYNTIIPNRVGIYFDYNPVVMTNTVHNTILIPSISVVSGSGGSICNGDSVVFTAAAISIREPYYQWNVNGVDVGGNSATYVATGLTDGSVVKCMLYNPAHDTLIATSNIVVMGVNPLPVAGSIAGATAVCVGVGETLMATVGGGMWSTSNANAVAMGEFIRGLVAGSTTVSYSVTNVCGTAVATHNMTVNPLPVAGDLSGSDKLCAGTSISLTASGPGGLWQVSNDKATVAGGVVTGVSAGAAVVSYRVSNICGSAVAKHTITVEPQPNAGTISGVAEVYVGASVSLASSQPDGTWAINNGNASIKDGTVTGVSAGQSTITYTYTNSCGTDVAYKELTVLETGPPTLLPNPATNVLTIKANGESYNSFVITNYAGKRMMEEPFTNPLTSINIRVLPAGVYYLKLVGNKGTVVRKFTKM